MANNLYDSGVHGIWRGDIIWKTGSSQTFKAVLVDTASYTVNLATHVALSDIPSGMRIATVAVVPSDPANRAVDSADIIFPAVTGAQSEAVVVYKDTGVASTSTLIMYIDTATGLPVTPNGTDIAVSWDNGTNKMVRIG